MTKYIRIDYTVKADVDLDRLKDAITGFVAGIRNHHPGHRYTSFQHPADPNRFIQLERSWRRCSRTYRSNPFSVISRNICRDSAPPDRK